MTRNYFKYMAVVLAVALIIMTSQYWAWPIIGALFIDDSNSPDLTGVPASWPAHQWESGDLTHAHYLAGYVDCSLHVVKNDTGMETVLVESVLVCSQEDGHSVTVNADGKSVEFNTEPADFEVDWDVDDCSMESSYIVEYGERKRHTFEITCFS